MNQDKLKLAGIVVLYNPVTEVISNIKSYADFIDVLFIIDNSEKKSKFTNELRNFGKAFYQFNESNIGIAAALNEGVKNALNAGYSYLLTLDQDSKFENDSLSQLILSITPQEMVGIYSPFHKNKYSTNQPINQNHVEVSDVMTSGNILNLEAVNKVGLFNEKYFIDYVDVEYCLRLRKNGYKILRVNNSVLLHNEANLSKKSFFGKTVYPPNHKPFRWYYKIRNYLYLKEEYQIDFPEYFFKESKNIRNNIIKVILFEQNKIIKFKMMIKGYLDFRKRITGKISE